MICDKCKKEKGPEYMMHFHRGKCSGEEEGENWWDEGVNLVEFDLRYKRIDG